MNVKLLLLLIAFPVFCEGQSVPINHNKSINYNDIIELKGLIYYKADTTLVTGKVIRYNRKNIAKQYILISKGKPDNLGWNQINTIYKAPEKSDLGDALKGAAIITGAVMAVTGNDINLPLDDYNGMKSNKIKTYLSEQNENTSKSYSKMSDRVDINSDIKSGKKISDGPYKEVNAVGQVKIIGNFINEKRNGEWQEFYDNGQLRLKGKYIDGKKEGEWNEYHKNGILESTVKHINGKKEGLFESYNDDGQLLSRINYKNGRENGLMQVYHDNGKIMMKGFFREALQIGEWKYYDISGKLINTEIHKE